MPLEPLPWDRKEYFKSRKQERSESVGSLTSSEDLRELTRCGSAEVRKRPVEEYGVLLQGVSLARGLSQPSEKILEDASVFQFKKKLFCSSAFDENCNRNSGVFGSPTDLTLDDSVNIIAERSCDAPHSDPVGLSRQETTIVSERRVSEGKMDQKLDDGLQHSNYHDPNDCSVGLDCKPIRWMRSVSLSSHESGLSRCSSSKSMSVGFSNSGAELPKQNLCQSASGDTITCVTPTTPSEEMSPWKKPRLRWGEGLAKFEKKSAGPDNGPNKSETIISCLWRQVSDCVSPATPSSAACSSYPGSEDKPFTKAVLVDNGKGISHTLVSGSQKRLESIPFNLEKLDLNIITHAVPSLIAMINSDNQCSADSNSTSCSILSKLLLLKSEILEAIDMAESQVDLLESELKFITNESGHSDCRCPASDTPVIEFIEKSGKDHGVSEMSCRSALPLHASTDIFVVKVPVDSGNSEGLKADMDSPGTVTSKLVELPPFTEPHAESGMIHDSDRFSHLDVSGFPQEFQKTSKITSCAGKMSNVCINVVGSNNSSLVSSDDGWHMAVDERLIDSIWASNREFANKASEDFNIVFPVTETIEGNSSDGCSKDLFLRELIVRKKKALRFKEQAVTLKWRALHSIWKDDMRLFSVRNQRSKAQKQCEIFSRTTQKTRPSVRSKFLHVKKSSLDMEKLLSISHLKPCQSVLKMPALILDDDERRMSKFLSWNGLVEDPCAIEKERSMINAWTSEEKDIFMEKLASHGKDFRKIASFLDHKTAADCVEFYYKNHKSESFTKTIKQRDQRIPVKALTNNTYLVTPAKKWDRNMDTASLDILGAASELVARNSECKENKKRNSCGFLKRGVGCTKPLQKDCLFPNRPSNFRYAAHDIGTVDNRISPRACGSVSSEAYSSCITSSINQGEGHCNGTPKTFSIISKPLSIPEDIQIDDEETCSDESSCELDVGYWTDREKSVFVRAVKSYGKDFCMVSRCVRTKSKDQCKSFYSKARKCLGLDVIHPDNDHEQQSVINDSNGDRSIPALTSTPEVVSETGSYKVSQRIDEDMSLVVSVTSNVDSQSPGAGMTFHAYHDKLKEEEGNLEKHYVDPKVEEQSMDKLASNPDPVCVWNKSTMSNDTNKQAFPIEVTELANGSVDISPSLLSTLPYLTSSTQVSERGSMEPPLLHNRGGENGTSSGIIQNNVSYFIEDPGTPKAHCQGPVDNRPIVGFTAGIPRQMYMYKSSVRNEASIDSLAHYTSCGISNSFPRYSTALPTPEISFAKISFGEAHGDFQRSHSVGTPLHRALAPSSQLYVSQNFKQEGEKNRSAWNLNFEDSTVSRGSHSDSENSLPSYSSIPQRASVQKCNSLISSCSVNELPYFKQSSNFSRIQTKNSLGPEKQRKQANFKLFGQVLITSTAPEPHPNTHPMEESKFSHFSPMNGTHVDMRPSNHRDIFFGRENLPVKGFWDGHLMQTSPLLAGCPLLLSHTVSSSSTLDRQPLQTTAAPNVNTSLNTGSIYGNSLNRSMMPHLSDTTITRRDL